MPWHSNSVNEASMLLLKDFSNNLKKKMFFMGYIIKIVLDQQHVTPTQSVRFM